MAHHYHAIVWIDHTEAKIFHFNVEHAEKAVVRAHQPMRQIHHKANSIGSGHATENQTYYHAVANEIADAGQVLITGPASAKTELLKHIEHHDAHLLPKIAGVEALDHPSDGELLAHARKYFKAADWMTNPG